MGPIQVDAVVLRGMLPDLVLRPGMLLAGRVLERHQGHGLLNLAGAVVVAELPDGVEAGARLRLAVQDIGEQVTLRVVPEAAPAAQQQHPAAAAVAALPLPGGAHARVSVAGRDEEGDGAEGGARTVTLHYDSPELGRLELRLALAANGLVATVGAPTGAPTELAAEHAAELRAGLGRLLGRPVEVHVAPRRDQVDLRA